MKRTAGVCLVLVLVPALVIAVLASGGTTPLQNPDYGFELAAVIEMISTPDGLRTVITAAPAAQYEPLRAFVIQHSNPSFLTYNGPARLWFKPGVLTVMTPDGRAWQFSVRRRGMFVPQGPADAALFSVVGIANHQTDHGAIELKQWASLLLGMSRAQAEAAARGLVVPPGSDRLNADCPDGVPTTCAGGGANATECSYGCSGTTCSITCAAGTYACCWCFGVALCGCCPA